ncbi:MAG: RusA family crossover junction endodeoxyribonuclease [Jiangellaceae bacterium]
MRLTISVVGRPAPQGSKRTGGAGQLLEQSSFLPAWKQAIKIAAFRAYAEIGLTQPMLPLFRPGMPVTIERCAFYMGEDQCRAAGTNQPVGTPDLDKLLRGVLDALGGGRKDTAQLYADDSQVVAIHGLTKQYATRPGAIIVVSDGRE